MQISALVKEQFPDFYKREGKTFISFVKSYYEWLEQNGHILDKTKNLLDYGDIDKTLDEFVDYFVHKYMADLPKEVVSDKRFLLKHIIDLYSSKGSEDGLRLFFKLLYNEDIDIYIPGEDILKPSDGTWVVMKYFEVEYADWLNEYVGQKVYGLKSKATAMVEAYEKRNYGDTEVHMLLISYIEGTFQAKEHIRAEGLDNDKTVYIKGSVTSLDILDGINHSKGDIFYDYEKDLTGMKVIVTSTTSASGIIKFNLIDGGKGYTTDAIVNITPGTNTTGSGASFRVGGIKNTYSFDYSPHLVQDRANVLLDAADYSNSPSDTSIWANSNINSLLKDVFEMQTIQVGEIDFLITESWGQGYDGKVNIEVIDPYTSPYNIDDGQGGIVGKDAVVDSSVIFGSGIIDSVFVVDSGFNYIDGQKVLLTDGTNFVTGYANLGGAGQSEGYWVNQKSFLNSDKYIQDSYFYQDFSYQIKSSKSFKQYVDILKKLMHMAGNEVFGATVITDLMDVKVTDNVA